MPESQDKTSLLCLTGCRIINKRMAMFLEGVQSRRIGVRIWSLPRGPWVLDKSEKPTVATRIGRFSADLGTVAGSRVVSILCFHWSVLPVAVFLGLIRRIPVIYDEHDHYELNTLEGEGSPIRRRVYSMMVRWIHRLCLPWVSLVTCIHLNEQTLKKHLERWQPSVLEIHNYPAQVWRESRSECGSGGKLCFVYIGGVYTEKGVAAAADAFMSLSDSLRAQAELHIFGEGDAVLIARLKTMPEVTVHNGVSPETFRKFTATHRCCGLSLLANTPRYSLVGTNCTKLYEYLALGMPVIATRVGEFSQFLSANRIGLLIDGSIPLSQLADAMGQLISDPRMFAECSANARTLMSRDEMTWEYEWRRIEAFGVVYGRRAA